MGLGLGVGFLAFVAYISLGLPDGLLGVAWPSIRGTFSLPLDSLGALFVSTTAGYLSTSFFAGRLTARFRLGALLAASTFFAGVALVGYALAPRWWVVVVFGVALGLGSGGIDAALNIYVAAHYGERMMQWLHAVYGIGAALVALFFAWRRIYRPAQACKPGDVCAIPQVRATYKLIFWVVAALVLVALGFPYVMPFFY